MAHGSRLSPPHAPHRTCRKHNRREPPAPLPGRARTCRPQARRICNMINRIVYALAIATYGRDATAVG